jgi:hypothetical protein
MNPFLDITLSPTYGKFETVVKWTVLGDYADGDFYIYKSEHGKQPWTLLNEDAVQGNMFVDTNFTPSNRNDVTHYRILLEKGDQSYDSPVVGLFDKLTRSEYKMARYMILQEYSRMKLGNGIQVMLFKPLTRGIPCGSVDEDTKQKIGVDCKDPENDCYGQRFKGGFNTGTQTWMELRDIGTISYIDAPDGTGVDDTRVFQVTSLPFPMPSRGDLIVHPATDNRFAVGDVKPHSFKGVVPINVIITLTLLHRKDPRYRLPVPPFKPERV